jgi:hypothetical protein
MGQAHTTGRTLLNLWYAVSITHTVKIMLMVPYRQRTGYERLEYGSRIS